MGAVRSNSKIDKRQDDSFYGKHACQDQITKLTAGRSLVMLTGSCRAHSPELPCHALKLEARLTCTQTTMGKLLFSDIA